MIYWAADSDPNSMRTWGATRAGLGYDERIGPRQRRMDWVADSDGCGPSAERARPTDDRDDWIDWAANCDPAELDDFCFPMHER